MSQNDRTDLPALRDAVTRLRQEVEELHFAVEAGVPSLVAGELVDVDYFLRAAIRALGHGQYTHARCCAVKWALRDLAPANPDKVLEKAVLDVIVEASMGPRAARSSTM